MWAVAWAVVGVFTVAILAVATWGLIRRVKGLSAAGKRFSEEVGPLTDRLRTEADRASSRLEQLPEKLPGSRPGGRIRR